jgi:ATP-dependent exoDNAse (exonuclease V) beta subunit
MIEARDRFLEIDDIKNARRHLTEIPVRGRVGKETVTGTIDRLVFSDNEGYSILDYKTDTIPKDGEAVVAKEYELQLAIYTNLLRSLLGDPEQMQLYFVSTNCFFGVEKDYPDLVEEIEEVAKKIKEL